MGVHRVSVRDFKARLSHYLGQAQAGEIIEVTSRRRVVARVVGAPRIPEGVAPAVAKMIESGAATWSGGKPKGAKLQFSNPERLMSDIILEDRN